MNKQSITLYLSLALICMLSSCGLDNYDQPQSKLVGRVVYEGQSIGLKGTREAVQLQLFQDGYELNDHIPVYLTQDGTFEALLFNGTYKLVTRDNNGPWINSRDTIEVVVNGFTEVQVPVKPYYTISGTSIKRSNSEVTGAATIRSAAGNQPIEYVTLLVNKTAFVDDQTNIAQKNINHPDAGPVQIQLKLPENNDVSHSPLFFGRIGVKIEGVEQLIYSEVIPLN